MKIDRNVAINLGRLLGGPEMIRQLASRLPKNGGEVIFEGRPKGFHTPDELLAVADLLDDILDPQ